MVNEIIFDIKTNNPFGFGTPLLLNPKNNKLVYF